MRSTLPITLLVASALVPTSVSAGDWFDDALPGPFVELRVGGTVNFYGTGNDPLAHSKTGTYPWFGPRLGWGMKDYRTVVGLGAAAIPWTDSDQNGGDGYLLAFYRRFVPELEKGLYFQGGIGSWISDMSSGETMQGPGLGIAAGWELPCPGCDDALLIRHIGIEASVLQGWNRPADGGRRSDLEPLFERHGTTFGLSASLMWY